VVQDCVNWLTSRYGATVENQVIREEEVYFPLPKELRAATNQLPSPGLLGEAAMPSGDLDGQPPRRR
jgi:hypothetical protein